MLALATLALAASMGCGRSRSRRVVATDAGVGAAPSGKSGVHASIRCEECHEKMRTEWRESGHSRAATAPLFVAMRAEALAADPAADCDSCHAPLLAALGADATAAREGVTCDVCHTMKRVGPGQERGEFELALTDKVRFGPICDAKDHYFHRMGCAPVFAQAEQCAGCHLLTRGGLPIYSDYADWKAGPAAADGMACQACHMPAVRAEVAPGEAPRDVVRDHGFLGKQRGLRQQAVVLTATVSDGPSGLVVLAEVQNFGAGHPIPAGSAERRLVVRVRGFNGDTAQGGEREFGRFLVDAAGAPAAPHRATSVKRDERIAMGKTAEASFTLPGRVGDFERVEVSVLWRSHSAESATRYGVPVSEVTMASLELSLGKGTTLPKSAKVSP